MLCEMVSRRLQRPITPPEVGLSTPDRGAVAVPQWNVDTLTALVDLGRSDVYLERRRLLAGAAYSVGGLVLPEQQWWDEAHQRAKSRPAATSRRVGAAEVSAVREMTEFFSRRDQRHGGMDGRTALHQYLVDDIARYIGGVFTSDDTRCALLSAASERAAIAALLRAEDDFSAADAGDEDPSRVWFFQRASLAHETARTLWTLGDLDGALREFNNSVLTRKADTFSRTHAVTLGYMGTVQARKGNVEAACHTWAQALDAMEGVQSGRAREAAVNMRRVLSPFRNRGISIAAEIDERAKAVLERVA